MIKKKVPYGRILVEGKTLYHHSTRGYKRKANQERLTNGYNRIIAFLGRGM